MKICMSGGLICRVKNNLNSFATHISKIMLVIITEDCKPMKQVLEFVFYGKYGHRGLQCL